MVEKKLVCWRFYMEGDEAYPADEGIKERERVRVKEI